MDNIFHGNLLETKTPWSNHSTNIRKSEIKELKEDVKERPMRPIMEIATTPREHVEASRPRGGSPGTRTLPLPEVPSGGSRHFQRDAAHAVHPAVGSRLAMAMGGGGGVPEQEDSVLFRRGTGQVRSWTAPPSYECRERAPSAPLPAPAAGPDLACSLIAGPYSRFLHLDPFGSLCHKLLPLASWTA